MKKSYYHLCFALSALILLFSSCKKDEGFHQISQIEREIYLKINDYRSAQGLNSLVEQFLIFKEGRLISEKLAEGIYKPGDPAAQNDVDEITDNLGGTSNALLTFTSNIENADSIVSALSSEDSTAEILRGEFTQCGVGFSTNPYQVHHIAVMLINIPN